MTNRLMQNQVRSSAGRFSNSMAGHGAVAGTSTGLVMMGSLNTGGGKNTVNIANPLNSSLVFKKGKERETPKKKKPSTLKKIILKEREEKRNIKDQQKQQLLLIDVDDLGAGSPVLVLNESNELVISPRISSTESKIELVVRNEAVEVTAPTNSQNKTGIVFSFVM
jgi:hypothetical protein